MPIDAFTKAPHKRHPATLEGGGKGAPAPVEQTKPPQSAKAPSQSVYVNRAQNAGKGGMSSGYQSTLLSNGVTNEMMVPLYSMLQASSNGQQQTPPPGGNLG